ncbi:MAG: hypothetical protein C4538_12860 [Nitrospiraceae bacterium]|nr:MAG: hypothetical protein C4538_12860 [Nitrospiraceae bacterium]
METLSIKKGRIIIYRLFDVASEINLSLVEAQAREGTKRLRLSKHPYMKALEFTNPPVSFELQGFDKHLFDKEIKVSIIAKAYDFGVISIAFDIPIPAGTAFTGIETVSKALDSDVSIYQKAREYVSNLVQTLGNAVISPGIKEEFEEDYMIFFIEGIEPAMEASRFLSIYDPSRLLLYETQDVSLYTKEETLKHRFSYYPNDLVILHLDNAFVIEPSGSSDIIDILEFANAQLLELRYYDHVLDKELSLIYSELPKQKRVSVFRLRAYERLAKKLTVTVTDLTEVTEKVDNALKVTEDVYYAKIYRSAMTLFRSSDWESSIKGKLQIVTNTYKMLYDEISNRRGHLLELWIIILIVIEIILLMVIEW